MGLVTAHFVRKGRTADDAIADRLKTLGRSARNWTVVSSDRRVQNDARALGASVIPSTEFARQVKSAFEEEPPPGGETGLSPSEVEEWLDRFRENKR
jgi:predicted RNA-binding protein with PIN domain